MADVLTAARDTARDAVYVAVGLGVLGFQRAQVRRRELQHHLETLLAHTPLQRSRASS
jgi:hypothetical protein